jgi:polygalacturonase
MQTVSPELPAIDQKQEIILKPSPVKNHASMIQQAIDACSAKGGGQVLLRPGMYRSGTIILRSGVTLHLEKGAVLQGSTDVADYLPWEMGPGARVNRGIGTALVYAEMAENIAITGEGKIDGSGHAFFGRSENPPDWVKSRKPMGTWIPGFEAALKSDRPRALILLVDCENVELSVKHVENSPAWTIHLLACTHVVMRGIELRGVVDGANTDGVDLDACSDVLVEDCDIFTGDDAMCLKNTNTKGLKRPSRRITVRRCRLRSTTHGFTIGTETQEDFEDITFTDSQIDMAGDYRTLTGIGLSILDGGTIARLRISNVTVSDSVAPIQIRLGNAGRGQEKPVAGMLRDIVLEDVTIRRAYGNSMIMGLPKTPIQNIALRRVSMEFDGPIDPAVMMPTVPEFDTEFPPAEVWRFLPAYGLYCRHVDGLELTDVTITTAVEEPRPALIVKNVGKLKATIEATE